MLLPVILVSLFALQSNYRQAYQQYLLAKNQYQQYQTENTRLTAISSLKTLLSSRNDLQLAYLKNLRQALADSTNIANYSQTTLYLNLEKELSTLEQFSSDISGITSLSQAKDLSQSWQMRLPVSDTLSQSTKNQILIARLQKLQDSLLPYIDSASPSSTLDLIKSKLQAAQTDKPQVKYDLLKEASSLLVQLYAQK
ncbi:MAG: hypothetical protein AAB697_00835 [Patescibacteria group bacterium]